MEWILILAVQVGSVTGRIELPEDLQQVDSRMSSYAPGVRGEGSRPARMEVPSPVIVYLEGVGGGPFPPPSSPAVVGQENLEFKPRVLAILVGTTVSFPNQDAVYHNVLSYSRAKRFDLGRYPTGESKEVVFDRPGLVQLFCEIHEHMRGYILVLENPHFAATLDGRFMLADVPPGTYTLVAWQESLRDVRREVTVPAGGVAEVNFPMTARAPEERPGGTALAADGPCCRPGDAGGP